MYKQCKSDNTNNKLQAHHWTVSNQSRSLWRGIIGKFCDVCSYRRVLLACVLLFHASLFAQTKHVFNIESQRADQALTQFAQQANTTLLFPFDLAERETANALQGEYTIELGIVKLLEGTGLYPVADESGMFSVKPIPGYYEQATETHADPVTTLPEQPLNAVVQELEKIAIVGTRAAPRSVIDSSVPLDIIDDDEFNAQGASDVLAMLSSLVPSLNVNDQPINDASSLVRPANLRGMASDHTLVLLNGKRRHRSAVITFLGGGLSDGAQGPDISNIPASALKQVEVLRDGAAAQYGSDAIAGVLNFVLKDDDQGGSLEARYGSYFQGDGELIQVQGNRGFSLFTNGFLNISAEYRQQDATSRSVQRDDAQALIQYGNFNVADPAQIWGSPDVDYDAKFSANFAFPVGSEYEVYGFSNYARRSIEGGFYYRHPHTRSGVNFGGVDENGTPLLLVGDLDGVGQGIECPVVTINDGNVLDDSDYRLIADNSTDVGRNCFAFNEIYPGGFTPRFGGKIKDASLFWGIKGETDNHWLFDISASLGYSRIDYMINTTINPSLGPDSPTSFSPGSAAQLEKNLNFDVSREFNVGLSVPLNFAAGVEWRRETFSQVAGDPASYQIGPLAFDPSTGQTQGFGIGSNGFPGYKPEAAGKWGRGNVALYTDFEAQLSEAFRLGVAARYENFTDFGSTLDGKISAKYDVTDDFALRGSVSTGFKAPTVGQSNVINVTTAFSTEGLEDQATLPPTNPISLQLGASPLTPEESTNLSFGLVGQLGDHLFLTLDYFNIRLTDRISTTSALPLTQQDIDTLLAQGVADASSFSSAKFFTNDFDTRTQGIDLVVNYSTTLLGAYTDFALAYNWTDTSVDRVTVYNRVGLDGVPFQETNLTEQRIRMLEDNLPAHRGTLTVKQQYGLLSSLLRLNYFDDYYEDHLDAAAGLDIYAGAEITLDLELSYQVDEHLSISGGAKNLFDNRPDENPFVGFVGSEYPPTAPMGINGGFYYLRSRYLF